MGAGVALIDYDNDGDLDVYLIQGTALTPGQGLLFPPPSGWNPGNRLFRNELKETGKLTFTDVTEKAGVGYVGYGMGVATGLAFDADENLYVGDRSGTIFKISRTRQIYVFATLEPSIAAYHLTMGIDGYLYVTGPTTSSFDVIHRIAPTGEVDIYYRGLGRPQGMAVDAQGNLYVAASLGGRRGVIRFDNARKPELFLSGPGIVGLAFAPSRALMVCTNNALYRVDAGIAGKPMP